MMIKYWSQHSATLTIRGINLMLAEAGAHNLGAVTSAYGIPEETIGRPEMRFTVDTEQEADGRWTAKISGPVPAESVYGATREEAVNKARDAMRKAYETAPQGQTKFTEWGIVFEQGIICSAVEQPEINKDGGVLVSHTASIGVRPFGMQGAPEAIEDHCRHFKASFAEEMYAKNSCPFCTKLRGEHSEAEATACVEALRKNLDRRSQRLEARKLAEAARKLRQE